MYFVIYKFRESHLLLLNLGTRLLQRIQIAYRRQLEKSSSSLGSDSEKYLSAGKSEAGSFDNPDALLTGTIDQ